MTAALAFVPRQEIVPHQGPGLLEWLARSAYQSRRERFVRPILDAVTEAEADSALRAHRVEYAVSQVSSTLLMVAIKPWRVVTPEMVDQFYNEIHDRLEAAPLEPELIQKLDYVIYSLCRFVVLARDISLMRRRRSSREMRDFRFLSKLKAFDLLTSAAIFAAEEPQSVRNQAVFSSLMTRAVGACDEYLGLLAATGYIED